MCLLTVEYPLFIHEDGLLDPRKKCLQRLRLYGHSLGSSTREDLICAQDGRLMRGHSRHVSFQYLNHHKSDQNPKDSHHSTTSIKFGYTCLSAIWTQIQDPEVYKENL